nr:carbohydrate porin [Klebsiella pneumoniae]
MCWPSTTTTTARTIPITVKTIGAIVRPMYFWNDVHSTGWKRATSAWITTRRDNHRLEADAVAEHQASAWGAGVPSELRFYVTGGCVDNEHTAKVNGTQDQQLDSLNVGGMFEAWF